MRQEARTGQALGNRLGRFGSQRDVFLAGIADNGTYFGGKVQVARSVNDGLSRLSGVWTPSLTLRAT